MEIIPESIEKLRYYIESEAFKGYDPYDTLNARMPFEKLGKWFSIYLTQIQKRNLVNIRPLLGIKKEYNPKAMGLLLQAYSLLYQIESSDTIKKNIDFIFNWLINNYSKGYSGPAWGYNFDWVSPGKIVKKYTPSIVVTAFVGKGLFKYYEITGNPAALEILRSSCNFILNDIPRTETDNGICFSYTPIAKDCCYNASMLGAEILAKVFSVTRENNLIQLSKKAVDFVIHHQQENGMWNYSIDLLNNKERYQIDFHQGFILDSLFDFMQYSGFNEERYILALKKGALFYFNQQFFSNGCSKWRLPKSWPVEIHNQAQGILTFSKLRSLHPDYLNFANRIAIWTIQNMQDKNGYFYYRVYRYYKNKIAFMRWSQAWMFLALSQLLSESKN